MASETLEIVVRLQDLTLKALEKLKARIEEITVPLAKVQDESTKFIKTFSEGGEQASNFVADVEERLNETLEVEEEADLKRLEARRRYSEVLAEIRERIEESEPASVRLTTERILEALDQRHEEELDRLRRFYADEAALDEIRHAQKAERERKASDLSKKILISDLENTSTIVGQMGNIFMDLYRLRGEKDKELFYLAKAAAIAEAIVNTALAVTKVLAQGGIWAIPLAAVIAAQGAVQVAIISAQTFASGGMVEGYSPTSKADNILIQATAGEFVHPVETVQHYGSAVMEALRRRSIPKELFWGLSLPSGEVLSPKTFQAGGLVEEEEEMIPKSEFTLINITDPQELDRYLATPAGKNAILNVISSRAQAVRKILR